MDTLPFETNTKAKDHLANERTFLASQTNLP